MKLCSVHGRKICIRDFKDDKVIFLNQTETVGDITCMTSQASANEGTVFAVAFNDLEDPSTVCIEIFKTEDPNKPTQWGDRIKYKLKLPSNEPPTPTEPKTTGCEYHDRKNVERAAAQAAQN